MDNARMIKKTEALDRVVREVIRLGQEQPFFASFLMASQFKATTIGGKGGAIAMSGKTLYYDPVKVEQMDRKHVRWALLTGAAKIGLGHHLRGGAYEGYELLAADGVKDGWKDAWQKASEVAASEVFTGGEKPDDAVTAGTYNFEGDRPAEYYYQNFRQKPPDDPGDNGDSDGDGDGSSSGGGENEGDSDGDENTDGQPSADSGKGLSSTVLPSEAESPEQAEKEWQQMLTSAAQAAKAVGKLPGAFESLIEKLLAPAQIPWQQKLRRFAVKVVRGGADYSRPNRHHSESEFFIPARRSRSVEHLAVVADTSGSMSEAEINEVLNEMKGIMQIFPKAILTLIECDAAVQRVTEFGYGKPWRIEDVKSWAGRGGTDMTPAFDHAMKMKTPPQGIICLTDGEFYKWPDNPKIPVFWLFTRQPKDVAYGDVSAMKQD